MAQKKDTQITGNIGMYWTCYRLSQLGWNVMPTARNARGVDVIGYNEDCSRMISVQVKALSNKNAVPLGRSLDKVMGDYWVIVSLATSPPRCFVLLPAEVRQLSHPSGKAGKMAYWLEYRSYTEEQFQEAWHRIV